MTSASPIPKDTEAIMQSVHEYMGCSTNFGRFNDVLNPVSSRRVADEIFFLISGKCNDFSKD
jgi:hypothetical protein